MLWERKRATRSAGCSLHLLLPKNRSLGSRDKVTGEQKLVPFSLFPSISKCAPRGLSFPGSNLFLFLLHSIGFSISPLCASPSWEVFPDLCN